MNAEGTTKRTNAWPTVMATFVIMALIVSAVSLGAVIHKSGAKTVVAGSGGRAAAAGPGFDFGADPPESFTARDPRAPVTPTGTVHKLRFDIVEKQIEIAPGVSQLMWTFNGQVPGPTLRGKVGDRFEITVVNHSNQAHSIDLHASKVAPNVMMRMILPGKSLLYTFTADHSGIFMYHCGTAPVLEHIAMGMYGTVIIDPPHLSPVAHEFVMVQSELYRESDPVQPVDYAKLLDEQWDAVVFNGYVRQYASRPIHVGVNQKIRIWVMNDGPSDISSFHIIGTIFDTVYKEGAALLVPGPNQGGGQALDLAPAQGGYVELTFAVPGIYPFLSHKFADAAKGAVGEFVVQ
ncbi:MAG TPA: multicopper oxidase domain-containing protein [Acidimicrobiia bacterium]